MNRIIQLCGVAALVSLIIFSLPASAEGDADSAPIYGIKIPSGYRDWTLISVSTVGGPASDTRAKLGNDVAIRAFREGKLPFSDGTIIARLAWKQAASEEIETAFRA